MTSVIFGPGPVSLPASTPAASQSTRTLTFVTTILVPTGSSGEERTVVQTIVSTFVVPISSTATPLPSSAPTPSPSSGNPSATSGVPLDSVSTGSANSTLFSVKGVPLASVIGANSSATVTQDPSGTTASASASNGRHQQTSRITIVSLSVTGALLLLAFSIFLTRRLIIRNRRRRHDLEVAWRPSVRTDTESVIRGGDAVTIVDHARVLRFIASEPETGLPQRRRGLRTTPAGPSPYSAKNMRSCRTRLPELGRSTIVDTQIQARIFPHRPTPLLTNRFNTQDTEQVSELYCVYARAWPLRPIHNLRHCSPFLRPVEIYSILYFQHVM